MRRRWVGFGLFLLCVVVAGRSLLACGDKYFFTVQGTRYLLASLSKDSNILIYKNESSETSRLFSRISVTGALSRAGFVTTVVTNESDFRKELGTRPGNLPWTIIIAGSADAEKFRAKLSIAGRSCFRWWIRKRLPSSSRSGKSTTTMFSTRRLPLARHSSVRYTKR